MLTARARVATARPARYGKQLCDHLGHRLETAWEDTHGVIGLPGGAGRCELDAEDGALVLTAFGKDAKTLATVQDVAGRHLERFGARDELVITWERVDGAAAPMIGASPGFSPRAAAAGGLGRLCRALHR